MCIGKYLKRENSSLKVMDRHWVFQELEAHRYHENWHIMCKGYQLYAPAPLIPRKFFSYSLLLEADTTLGPKSVQ
jgi:hypothetical protein